MAGEFFSAGAPLSKLDPPSAETARLQRLLDAVLDQAIFMLDRSGRIETWNAGAGQLYGHATQEIVGRPFAMLHPADADAALANVQAGGRAELESWYERRDGVRVRIGVALTAVGGCGDALVGYAVVARDVTAGASEAQGVQDERFRALVETAQDYAIFMLDTTGRIVTWNAGAQRIKGYAADEIIGHHFSRFYRDEEARNGTCERELEVALREGRFEDEGWRVRKDGSMFWANVVIAPLRDRGGAHIGFSKITRDLTERRTAEQVHLDLARAQEALRLRDEFLSIASHELRTPLGALQLQMESLRLHGSNLDAKQRSKVERASRNVLRLADLITALLDVSRIAQGRLTLTRKRVELAALTAEVIDRLHEPAQEAGCVVVPDLGGPLEGTWDPLRIGQVISNLLSNAFKYAAGSRVDVGLVRDGDMAVLKIEDHGPGIPETALERIFGRFERAAPRNFGGMGLGLYVARELIAAHGGAIRARNRDGGGVTFEVRLPTEVPT